MGFPMTETSRIRSGNDARLVARYLNNRHRDHYMVWNMAEETYDRTPFDNHVRASRGTALGAVEDDDSGIRRRVSAERSHSCDWGPCAAGRVFSQVIDYAFPGYPAPPLSKLFGLCVHVEHWLDADPANVAVIHCMVRGRGKEEEGYGDEEQGQGRVKEGSMTRA